MQLSENKWLRRLQILHARLTGRKFLVELILPQSSIDRIYAMRAKLANVRGNRPTTNNDVLENAIDVNYEIIQALTKGGDTFIRDKDGRVRPYPIYD